MFKQGTKAHAIYSIVEAVLLFVVGILALVFRANADAYSVAFTIVGVMVIVVAALGILADVIMTFLVPAVHMAIMSKTGSIITNSLQLAIGIALCLAGSQFADYGASDAIIVFNFAALFIGVALVVAGGLFFIYAAAFLLRAPSALKKQCIFPFVISAVILTIGILDLCLVWNSNHLMELIFVIAGIIMLSLGLAYLAYGVLELLGKIEKDEVVVEAASVEEKPASEE